MIRNLIERSFGDLVYIEAVGLSVDSKPTENIITGSKFTEVDTAIDYLFDEASGTWSAVNTGNGKTSIANATVTLGSALTYTGSEQTQAVSTVKIGSTTLTASTDYEVSGNKGTNAGDYVLAITGKGSYAGGVSKEWSIAKANSSLTLEDESLSLTVGTDGETTVTVVGDGILSVNSSDTAVATATINTDDGTTTITVTPVAEGTATVTVSITASDNYNAATATLSISVSEE